MGTWTPTDIIELARLILEFVLLVAGVIGIFTTKANVSGMRKDMDGRFSQLLDLVGRLSGAPERRSSVDRRVSNHDTPHDEPR